MVNFAEPLRRKGSAKVRDVQPAPDPVLKSMPLITAQQGLGAPAFVPRVGPVSGLNAGRVAAGEGADLSSPHSHTGECGHLRRAVGANSQTDDPLGGSPLGAELAGTLRRRRGAGVALDEHIAARMGGAFGADFGAVRLHTDAEAGRVSRSIQAKAFTHGSDIYFADGAYAPSTPAGEHLLAHELAHVTQPAVAGEPRIGRADDPAEAHADRVADSVLGALRRQAVRPAAHQARQQANPGVNPALRRQVDPPGGGGAKTMAPVRQATNVGATGNPAVVTKNVAPPGKDSAQEVLLKQVALEYAEKVIASVEPIEAKVTPILQSIAKANVGKLVGLEHKLKTPKSLQGKLADLVRTRVQGSPDRQTLANAFELEAANIKDALRYTIVVPPPAYAVLADSKLKDALADVGATRIKASNAWAEKDASYKGFNSAYQIGSADQSVTFEVQVHTPESWDVKSEMHQQYEDARKGTGMSKAGKTWLENVMKARWKAVEVPEGLDGYDKNMKKK